MLSVEVAYASQRFAGVAVAGANVAGGARIMSTRCLERDVIGRSKRHLEPLVGSNRRRRGDDRIDSIGAAVMRGQKRVLDIGSDDELAGQGFGVADR
jgi:hypothetical protein